MESSKAPKDTIAIQTIGEYQTFYLCLQDDELTEIKHNSNQRHRGYVGDAKPETPVAYTFKDGKRTVFCLDQNNHLQNYEANDGNDDWKLGKLNDLEISAHPNTKIAVSFYGEKIRVYFQDPAGQLQEVSAEDGKNWNRQVSTLPATEPVVGSSLAAITLRKNSVFVFYVCQDYSIHSLASEKNGKWTDSMLSGTDDRSKKTSLHPINYFTRYGLRYLNDKGDAFLFEDDATRKIGYIRNNEFVSTERSDMRRKRFGFPGGKVAVFRLGNNTVHGGGKWESWSFYEAQ